MYRYIIFLLLSSILLLNCGDDEKTPNFDRADFLAWYGKDMLPDRMQDFTNHVNQLSSAVDAFIASPQASTLSQMRSNYNKAVNTWQRVNLMNFGPGGKDGLRLTLMEELALWPLFTVKIEEKIVSGSFDMDDSFRNTRGLMTIGYLIFPSEDINEALSLLTSGRRDYLSAVMQKMKEQTNDFNNSWQVSSDEFIANNGTDVKSSTTLLYNEWIRSFELLKNMKLVEPLGMKAGQSGPEPQLAECPYSGESLENMKLHFQNLVDLYYGKNGSIDSIGWDDYVKSVEGGEALVQGATDQIEKVNQALMNVPTDQSFEALLLAEHPSLVQLNKEFQDLLPYWKSDMSSLLGLAITFSSSDGD